MKRAVLTLAVSCLIGAGLACDSKSGGGSSGGKVAASTIKGPGVAKGKIVFNGVPPVLADLKNAPCCDGAPATLKDETVIVNSNGTLSNVVVYLTGGPRADGKELPAAKMDQKFCQYVPHVVPVVTGQNLHITTSDPVWHNVHFTALSGETNKTLKTVEESMDVSFSVPEAIKTKCDVHPWMGAWIFVIDTPLFAVTGADGTFSISNIPPGEYKLTAWHEKYGRIDKPISIKDGSPVEQDLTYAPPAQ